MLLCQTRSNWIQTSRSVLESSMLSATFCPITSCHISEQSYISLFNRGISIHTYSLRIQTLFGFLSKIIESSKSDLVTSLHRPCSQDLTQLCQLFFRRPYNTFEEMGDRDMAQAVYIERLNQVSTHTMLHEVDISFETSSIPQTIQIET